MDKKTILATPSMPLWGSSYPKGPYRFINREYLVISYHTDIEALRAVVPEPLEPESDIVSFEFMAMPDSSGFGDYSESGVVIPCLFKGEPVNFTLMMYLDDEPPITAGREIWGFPKKFGRPKLEVIHDTLTGSLNYAEQQVALGTMKYKNESMMGDQDDVKKRLGKKQMVLKLIPHVDGSHAIAQLVTFSMTDITVKGAWSGQARLALTPHVNAPVADLPVRKIIGGNHFIADMTLPYGAVAYDYLAEK